MLRAIPTFIASGVVLVFSLTPIDAARAKDSDFFKKTGDVKLKPVLALLNQSEFMVNASTKNILRLPITTGALPMERRAKLTALSRITKKRSDSTLNMSMPILTVALSMKR